MRLAVHFPGDDLTLVPGRYVANMAYDLDFQYLCQCFNTFSCCAMSCRFHVNSIKKVCGACRHVATPHKLMLHLPHCTFALSLQWHPRGSMRPEVLDSICDISSHPFSFSPPTSPPLKQSGWRFGKKNNRRALIGAIYCPPLSDSRLMFL